MPGRNCEQRTRGLLGEPLLTMSVPLQVDCSARESRESREGARPLVTRRDILKKRKTHPIVYRRLVLSHNAQP